MARIFSAESEKKIPGSLGKHYRTPKSKAILNKITAGDITALDLKNVI